MKTVLIVIQFIICLVLIVTVLLQESKSAGLSGSISGGAEQLFGKKKGQGYEDMLKKVTSVCAVLFMIMSVVLVIVK